MRRFAALLLVAFAAPLSAADPIWALQQAISDRVSAIESSGAVVAADVSPKSENVNTSSGRVDGVTACRCGASCDCVDCDCPGCPHRKGTATQEPSPDAVVKAPHLVASVWSSGCVHGERWLREAYPELLAKGWRIEVRRVSPDSGVACPTFAMGGRTWSGYTGKASHFAALKGGESVRVTHDARPKDSAKPVQTPMVLRGDYHVHVCRRCGHSWSHHDSNAGNAAAHRCPNCGNYEYRIANHSGLAPALPGPVTYQMQSSGGCPGGVCPPRSGGLFGWGLFR